MSKMDLYFDSTLLNCGDENFYLYKNPQLTGEITVNETYRFQILELLK